MRRDAEDRQDRDECALCTAATVRLLAWASRHAAAEAASRPALRPHIEPKGDRR